MHSPSAEDGKTQLTKYNIAIVLIVMATAHTPNKQTKRTKNNERVVISCRYSVVEKSDTKLTANEIMSRSS